MLESAFYILKKSFFHEIIKEGLSTEKQHMTPHFKMEGDGGVWKRQ